MPNAILMFSLIYLHRFLLIARPQDDDGLTKSISMMTILYISLKKMIPRFLVGARWEIIEQSRLNTPLDLFDFSYYNYKVIYI